MKRGQEANRILVTLARESRGLSQKELSVLLGIPQGRLSKIEHGLLNLNEEILENLSHHLNYPIDFFFQEEKIYTPGYHFYRKFKTIPKKTLNVINANINIWRIHFQKFLSSIEIKQNIPSMDIEEYGTSQEIARSLRYFWNIPNGPIDNVSKVLEQNGIPIILCDFGTRKFDGVSMWLDSAESREESFKTSELDSVVISPKNNAPIMFLNSSTPGDRFRFTLCHELAHIIMHRLPRPEMDDEANQFASEFLMPEQEIISSLSNLTLNKVASLKKYWKVSMASIIERAYRLDKITKRQRTYLWTQMSKLGYKTQEPKELEIKRENPLLLSKIFKVFINELDYSIDDFIELFSYNREDIFHIYGCYLPEESVNKLRVVKIE